MKKWNRDLYSLDPDDEKLLNKLYKDLRSHSRRLDVWPFKTKKKKKAYRASLIFNLVLNNPELIEMVQDYKNQVR